jgi:hypothetical protein
VSRHESDGGTTIRLDLAFAGFGSNYTGELAVRLAPDGLKVTFDGASPENFRSNRIGLVVLHRPR